MKRLCVYAFAAMLSASAIAMPADRVLRPVPQSDGTTVSLRLNGDWWFSWYTTEDGLVVQRDADGTLCYARATADGLQSTGVAAHNIGERSAQELQLVESLRMGAADCSATTTQQALDGHLARRAPRRNSASTNDGLGKYGTPSNGDIPSIGDVTIPVIMVEFADTKFMASTTDEKMSRYLNDDGYHEDNDEQRGSVAQYFRYQSNGMFRPVFEIVDRVTLSKDRVAYSHSVGDAEGAYDMMNEAVAQAVKDGVDFSKYYVNGCVPNLCMFYAGPGAATGGGETCMWPHEASLTSSTALMNRSGYRFASYFVGNEVQGALGSTQRMGMGVLCHELSHGLGLPDFYITNGSSYTSSPFGEWDIMDYGGYRNESYAPVGYSAYERSFMGWLDLRHLTEAEAVTLANRVEDPTAEYAVVIDNDNHTAASTADCFVLENRQPGDWFDHSGLLIGHYAYNAAGWRRNDLNNNGTFRRANIVSANGQPFLDYNINATQLFGNNVTRAATLPAYAMTLTGKPVYKIANHDGVITFSYLDYTLSAPTAPQNRDGSLWQRVTSMDDVSTGDTVIFVAQNANATISKAVSNTVRMAADIDLDSITGLAWGNAQTRAFRFNKASTGKVAFQDPEMGYLYASTGGLAAKRTWSRNDDRTAYVVDLSFDSDGHVTAQFGGTADNRYLGYSLTSDQFDTFAEAQANVCLYKRVDASTGVKAITGTSVNSGTGSQTPAYNLAGQRVSPSFHGIVIKNGVKRLQ